LRREVIEFNIIYIIDSIVPFDSQLYSVGKVISTFEVLIFDDQCIIFNSTAEIIERWRACPNKLQSILPLGLTL
jgi:hypothetical protein